MELSDLQNIPLPPLYYIIKIDGVNIKILKDLTEHSYKAYIVGGFVRDQLLGIESNDIDITTNATPKEIKEIFEDSCLPTEDYGSVTVCKKGINFEINLFTIICTYDIL